MVVSDWVMPEMDGVELCRRIRGRNGADPVHFIMLTAHSEKADCSKPTKPGWTISSPSRSTTKNSWPGCVPGIRAAKLHDELVRKATGRRR